MNVNDYFTYQGLELELFSSATNWKRYLLRIIGSYLGCDVLEVGAGIGSTTRVFCDGSQKRWLCIEPDKHQANVIYNACQKKLLPSCCKVKIGAITELSDEERFDTILYIDVLEHIQNDALEIANAASRLLPCGHLIVVCPAHQYLFSPFDKSIGHFRRYNQTSLLALMTSEIEIVKTMYIDSIGFFASLINRLLLRTEIPSHLQIKIWDRIMVPITGIIDLLINYTFGKSIVVIWKRKVK